MTILDDVLGQIPAVNKLRGVLNPELPLMTAYLNTKFMSPVRIGGSGGGEGTTILVRARTVKRDGRKLLVEGHMEDEKGVVLARAEGLFIQVKPKL